MFIARKLNVMPDSINSGINVFVKKFNFLN